MNSHQGIVHTNLLFILSLLFEKSFVPNIFLEPGMDFHILIWGGGGGKIFGGGAFSSKLIQLCLNSIYNSEFRYNWGVQKPFEGVLNTSAPPPENPWVQLIIVHHLEKVY